jgi:TonB family protein
VEVAPDGRIHNAELLRSAGMGLDEMASAALLKWRFQPGTKDGQPVSVQATIEVNFRLL